MKTWVDMVVAGTERSNERLLDGKPVVLLTTRGGGYRPGRRREGWDNNTPYLRRILADLWGGDRTVVDRELLSAGMNPAYNDDADLAEIEKKDAREAAVAAGRALAVRTPTGTASVQPFTTGDCRCGRRTRR